MTETRLITSPIRLQRTGVDGLPAAVWETLPFGLLVTEPGGVVVASNPEGVRALDREDVIGRRCCALLGCGSPDGPLADGCVTERALAEGRPLPEVRVDVDARDGLRGVWVTAAPLGTRQVLLHLRQGRAGDRRRRSDTAWSAGPQLTVSVLGRTRIQGPGGPLDGAWLRQRPGLLLKLLVVNRRRAVQTEELASAFWPDADRTARQNVRFCVHDLRGKLEPDRAPRQPSSFVTGHDGGYGLDRDRVRVDADAFERQARMGLAAAAAGESFAARHALTRAADLYQGDFLADEPYAEWAFAERDRLHELACRVLEALTELALAASDPEAAIERLQRLAELEPLDQSVSRRLIGLLLEQGRSGEALRRFKQVQATWHNAFGEELDFDLASLRRSSRAFAA